MGIQAVMDSVAELLGVELQLAADDRALGDAVALDANRADAVLLVFFDIEDQVDLAIIVFPSAVAHMALEQCGQKGIKSVIIIDD